MDASEFIISLFTNPIFLSALFSWLAAMAIKAGLIYYRSARFSWLYFGETGGMPSAHTAVVSALTLSVLFYQGITALFVVTLFFALIIIRNVLTFQQIGDNARVINLLAKKAKLKNIQLKEDVGHSIKAVIAGFCIALIVILFVFWLTGGFS